MNREGAKQEYHQYRELLRAYPAEHRERLAYEAKMADMAKKFPGIEVEEKK
jgi:hypothetical protein